MNAKRGHHRRAGFTLLELLISAALTATLLVMVWSLFGIYTKLNDRGVEQATELQLARALMQQFRADLRNIIQPLPRRPTPGLPTGSVPQRTLSQAADVAVLPTGPALVGTATSLTFAVRSTRPALPPTVREDSRPSSEPPLPAIYDVVSYRWKKMAVEPTRGSMAPDAEGMTGRSDASAPYSGGSELFDGLESSGLTRRVTPWQLVSRQTGLAAANRDDAATMSSKSLPEQPDASEVSMDAVPEVSRLRFRYFDGRRWLSSWNNSPQQPLPVAIEVTFELESPEKQRRRLLDPVNALDDRESPSSSAEDASHEIPSLAAETDAGRLNREPMPGYRLAIAVDPGAKPPPGSKASVP